MPPYLCLLQAQPLTNAGPISVVTLQLFLYLLAHQTHTRTYDRKPADSEGAVWFASLQVC